MEDDETASDVRMCATFANSGPLPLLFADAIFQAQKGILSDVAACVSFYLLVWSPLFWTLGRIILGTHNTSNEDTSSSATNNAPWKNKLKKRIALVLSPPVVGSLLGLFVGSQSTLRNLFFQPSGLFHPIFSAAKSFGNAYLPAALLVLAGSLVGNKANTVNAASSSSNYNTITTTSRIHTKTILTLLFSRFILAPLVALSTMRFLSFLHVLPTSNPRSLAIVTYTILCEGCMPPAQNSVVMLQLDGKRDRAAKMAKLLTVLYTLATIPITLLLSACLGISGILNYT
jgi:predicted permease